MVRAAAFVVAVILLLAAEGYGVFVHRFGLASNASDASAVLSNEFAGETSLAQTFRMGAAGFNRLIFHPRQPAGPAHGRLIVDLVEIDATGDRPLFQAMLRAEAVAGAERWSVELPERPDSRGRLYRATFSMPDAEPGHGLALMIVQADRYPAGTLHIGGEEQWGDIVFETGAARATVWTNIEHVVGGAGSWKRDLALVAVLLQGVATVILMYAFTFRRD